MLTTAISAAALEVDEQYLLEKALDYDQWFQMWHSPTHDGGFGSAVEVEFTDPENTEVKQYEGRWDSCLWTGTYLGGQAFRYAVTRDEQARQNARKAANALHHHLMVTGVPGYVSRIVVPNIPVYAHDFQYNGLCHDGTGDYEGTIWCENTSRDQYTGYWFGNSLAFDLIDDPDLRNQIRSDIRQVYDYFVRNKWTIIRPNGEPSTAGPQIGPVMMLAWLLIGHDILEDPEIWDLYMERFDEFTRLRLLDIDSNSLFNRYSEYYGNNLRNQAYFNIFRLDPDPARQRVYLDIYERGVRTYTRGTHNVWIDLIYLSGCLRHNACMDGNGVLEEVLIGLTDFWDPPHRDLPVGPIPQMPMDPFPQIWNGLIDSLGLPPEIADEIRLNEQPLYAQEVRHRCHGDFIWQRSPFRNSCEGGDGSFVRPGIDYVTPYWMGRYLDLIPPGNPLADDDDDTGDGVDYSDPPPGPGDDDSPPESPEDDEDDGVCGG